MYGLQRDCLFTAFRGGDIVSTHKRQVPGMRGMGRGGMRGGPNMAMPVEKAKDFKGTLRRLLSYLRPHAVLFLTVILMTVFSVLFSVYAPKVMGMATNKLYEGFISKINGVPGAGIDFTYISKILMILGSLYIFSALFNYIQHFITAGVAQKIVFDLRKDINEKFSKLPLKYFDSNTHGEILSRVINDVDNISSTLQQSIIQLTTSAVTLIGIVIMMFTISVSMTLILMLTLPLYTFIAKAIAKQSQKHFISQQTILGELNGYIEEMYTGHKVIRAFGREEICINEFDNINKKLYDSSWKAQFISGIIMPLMFFVNNIGYVLICVVGGIFVTRQRILIGDIQAFIQYSRQFTQPIIETANIANIIQSTIASAERVFEVLDEVEELPDAQYEVRSTELNSHEKLERRAVGQDSLKSIDEIIRSPQGYVKFNHVDFSYMPDKSLIKDMNIDVKQGQIVAIVGPTGAGKTTLVNLLMRFYEISEGNITIDGVDIREFKRGDLRSLFGMVLQDTWLFNGTIRDNIAYGRIGATEEEVINAAKAAHAHHFIKTLPKGYDTVLNEEASNISQGQKQLLTIARTILADPAILILDEATSSVDTRTEVYVQRAMKKLMEGRTSFVIAHRLSTIRDADLILVMNEGSIIEKGNHEQLLGKGGFYAELYNSQFTNAIGDGSPVAVS